MVVLGRAGSQVALNSGSLHFQTFPSSLWRTQHPLLHTPVSSSPLFSGQAQATPLLPCVSIASGSVFVHDPLQSDLMIPSSLLPLLPSLSICPLLAPPQRPRTKFSKSLLKTKILSPLFPSRFGFLSHFLPQRVFLPRHHPLLNCSLPLLTLLHSFNTFPTKM